MAHGLASKGTAWQISLMHQGAHCEFPGCCSPSEFSPYADNAVPLHGRAILRLNTGPSEFLLYQSSVATKIEREGEGTKGRREGGREESGRVVLL